MRRGLRTIVAGLVLVVIGCSSKTGGDKQSLVLYSGRSESLVAPLVARFVQQTGINVRVKYGKSAQLVLTLQEEGERSPADVFWSQDAGALGVLSNSGRLAKLPGATLDRVPDAFRHARGQWVATSGRARVLAYSSDRVAASALPHSAFDLTDPSWRGRVGWAPMNASFQSFVTAMRKSVGEDRTTEWLLAMKANGTKAYPKNTAIIEAIAAGEIDLGLPNHYYLMRFKKNDADYPVEQTFFAAGDIGNLVNVAGAGIITGAENSAHAQTFIDFLLVDESQAYFEQETFEYAVVPGEQHNPALGALNDLLQLAPTVDLNELDDLAGTLELLRRVGLL